MNVVGPQFLARKMTDDVGKASWKKRKVGMFEVRKFPFKLESTKLVLPIEVGKFSMQYKVIEKFPTSARTFQLHAFQFHFEFSNLKVSNFSFFPTSCNPVKATVFC